MNIMCNMYGCVCVCVYFHYAAKEETTNILSSFEGTDFGKKSIKQTTQKFVTVPQTV